MLSNVRRKLRPLRLAVWCIKGYLKGYKVKPTENKTCWIVGTPDHKNLGDHAITYATQKFVKNILPDYSIETITEGEFYNKFISFKNNLKKTDVIILQGGGNLGNLYQYIEDMRRIVINSCKKNPIIMFPQSLFFTDDKIGNIEKQHTKKLYSKNSQIFYFAREKYSKEKMKEIFDNNRVFCVPDIVLSLRNVVENVNKREGIICCFRSDKESALTNEQKNNIIGKIKKMGNIEQLDTVCDYMVSEEKREEKLFQIWNRFASAELVITDRLHGMIFSIITNTPCIAISNNNKKLLGVYHWIESLDFVQFVDDVDKIDEEALKMINMIKEDKNQWNDISDKYSQLINVLQEVSNNG